MSTILDAITEELGWRESEIATMRLLLEKSNTNEAQNLVLLRAAWALLYAHYEGFCKNVLTIYYEQIERLPVRCNELPESTKTLALRSSLKTLRSLGDHRLLQRIEQFPHRELISAPRFPEVETRSNLGPDILRNILLEADLDTAMVDRHEQKLKTLVARRNGIAHGERNMISENRYYNGFEEAVYDIMYDIAYQIEDRLSRYPYADRAQVM